MKTSSPIPLFCWLLPFTRTTLALDAKNIQVEDLQDDDYKVLMSDQYSPLNGFLQESAPDASFKHRGVAKVPPSLVRSIQARANKLTKTFAFAAVQPPRLQQPVPSNNKNQKDDEEDYTLTQMTTLTGSTVRHVDAYVNNNNNQDDVVEEDFLPVGFFNVK